MQTNFKITYTLKDIQPPFNGGELELNENAILSFYFIENIENMFLTGALKIEDTGGLFEQLPLTGEESLTVTIEQDIQNKTDNEHSIYSTKTINFEFYKIEILDAERQRTETYKLYLVEKGFFNYIKKQYSKSYNQKKISQIVDDIFKNQLNLDSNNYDIEETKDKIDFIIPYWKPLTTLRYLTKLSKRQKSPQESGFLLYTSTGDQDQKVPMKKFISFATLLEENIPSDDNSKYYYKKDTINPNFINVFREVRNPHFSNRGILNNGISGKKSYGVDFTNNKKIFFVSKKYSEFVTSAKMLGKTSYLSLELDEIDSQVKFSPYNEDISENIQDYDFRMALESFNKREVLLDGSLDRHAGQLIYLEQMSDNDVNLYEPKNSGPWIIKGITHYFVIDGYEQKMTILKDAYSDTDVEGHLEV